MATSDEGGHLQMSTSSAKNSGHKDRTFVLRMDTKSAAAGRQHATFARPEDNNCEISARV